MYRPLSYPYNSTQQTSHLQNIGTTTTKHPLDCGFNDCYWSKTKSSRRRKIRRIKSDQSIGSHNALTSSPTIKRVRQLRNLAKGNDEVPSTSASDNIVVKSVEVGDVEDGQPPCVNGLAENIVLAKELDNAVCMDLVVQKDRHDLLRDE